MSYTYINGHLSDTVKDGYHVFNDGEHYASYYEAEDMMREQAMTIADEVSADYHTLPDSLIESARHDITDTAICITRELYELESDHPVREALLDGCEGYCAEREKIAELARVFDTAYDNLSPEVCNALNPWDMEMIPLLLHCAPDWSGLYVAEAILCLENWVALDQIEEAKRRAKQ